MKTKNEKHFPKAEIRDLSLAVTPRLTGNGWVNPEYIQSFGIHLVRSSSVPPVLTLVYENRISFPSSGEQGVPLEFWGLLVKQRCKN